jgi:hypothetical protein
MEPMDILTDTRRYLDAAIRQLTDIEAGAPIAQPLTREEAINIVTEQIGLFESVLRRAKRALASSSPMTAARMFSCTSAPSSALGCTASTRDRKSLMRLSIDLPSRGSPRRPRAGVGRLRTDAANAGDRRSASAAEEFGVAASGEGYFSSQRSDGFRKDSGPSRGDCCRAGFRPKQTCACRSSFLGCCVNTRTQGHAKVETRKLTAILVADVAGLPG